MVAECVDSQIGQKTLLCFFFSSRRRHTRSKRDWSSDVCSSDLGIAMPETQRRRNRYPVREMSGWSEGERTTVAILLYCTLVKLRAQSRGHADRRAEVSALLLDNPIGKASKPEFLEMHRWIAGALGVQLIYATGINDP